MSTTEKTTTRKPPEKIRRDRVPKDAAAGTPSDAPTSRDKLVAATRALLLRVGHAGCSVKAIAAEAGVNHGLVHHYFGSKEALLLEVLKAEAESMRSQFPRPEAVKNNLHQFIRNAFLDNPQRMQLVGEFFAMARHHPDIHQAVTRLMASRRQMLMNVMGIDAGTATLFQGAFFGLGIQRTLDPGLPSEEAGNLLTDMILVRTRTQKDNPTPPPHTS